MAVINGSKNDDTLQGLDGEANTINGLGGNDQIDGSNGNDTLKGGAGNDVIYGGAGNDILIGGTGSDTLTGDGSDIYLFSQGDGIDEINDFGGNTLKFTNVASTALTGIYDTGYGNNRYDLVFQYGNGDQITVVNYFYEDIHLKFRFTDAILSLSYFAQRHNGTVGNDDLHGFSGMVNAINGLAGNDFIYGADGNDKLTGGTGNDILYGGNGADTYLFSVGDGQDEIHNDNTDGSVDMVKFTNAASTAITGIYDQNDHNGHSNLVIQYGNGDQIIVDNYFYGDAYSRVKKFQFTDTTLTLSYFAQRHNGTADANGLLGFNGIVNVISGLAGNDFIRGGDGNDTLNGGLGNDTVEDGNGNDNLIGGAGNDILGYVFSSNGNDTLIGGTGNDELIGGSGVDVYVFSIGDGRDKILAFGSDGNSVDMVQFTNVALNAVIKIYDKAGDLVFKYGSDDQITLPSYFESAILIGSVPNPIQFQLTDVTLDLLYFIQHHNGTFSTDQLHGFNDMANVINGLAGNDHIGGGNDNDTLNGGVGNDFIDGGDGNDTVNGGIGDDACYGGNGNDKLNGDDGNDGLIGGLGKDTLNGGLGADHFSFNSEAESEATALRDTVLGFNTAQGDKIDLSGIDANISNAGNQPFTTLAQGSAFSGVFAYPGELYFDQTTKILYGNNDTDNAADFSLLLIRGKQFEFRGFCALTPETRNALL